MVHNMICICCPIGCHLAVDDSDKNNITVTGNNCVRGKNYGISEVTEPKRIVTSSVKVLGGELPVVSVKTKDAIFKEKVFECLEVLKNVSVNAPVKIGDIVVSNVLGTGIDVVATKNIEKLK